MGIPRPSSGKEAQMKGEVRGQAAEGAGGPGKGSAGDARGGGGPAPRSPLRGAGMGRRSRRWAEVAQRPPARGGLSPCPQPGCSTYPCRLLRFYSRRGPESAALSPEGCSSRQGDPDGSVTISSRAVRPQGAGGLGAGTAEPEIVPLLCSLCLLPSPGAQNCPTVPAVSPVCLPTGQARPRV